MAILLPRSVRAEIAAAVAPLRERLPNVRWVRTGQLHLTLRFIGDVERARVATIGAALRRALAPLPEPRLALEGGGAFPSAARPSVLWVGVRPSERLSALHGATEAALGSVGIPPEGREFHPHVTVGRVPRGRRPRGVGEAIADLALEASTPVREVSLVESVLGRGGARHTTVETVPLSDTG